ncbi:hypothetical protein AVEN_130230-1 [Araneus ventricosus]|uniref:Uncharacterized protein n=1 Tax=Araneus ventricosus TaxID=182803 RepID=A0A4Y2BCX4_ARAVE|nr:hypothetical protein AVEN_130230-1 [Araneus ventricosus]
MVVTCLHIANNQEPIISIACLKILNDSRNLRFKFVSRRAVKNSNQYWGIIWLENPISNARHRNQEIPAPGHPDKTSVGVVSVDRLSFNINSRDTKGSSYFF